MSGLPTVLYNGQDYRITLWCAYHASFPTFYIQKYNYMNGGVITMELSQTAMKSLHDIFFEDDVLELLK